MERFDVIVIGAGHAGIEAASAARRLGATVLMVTVNKNRIGYMSCNPSIGGLGKGHIVREVDVLGGEMGLAADKTCIQFKRLNTKKGPAVRGSRSQCDKDLYVRHMTEAVESLGVRVLEGEVKALILEGDRCVGIELGDGSLVRSTAVILTSGTFMNAVMHCGSNQSAGGRAGDCSSIGLSDQLRSMGFRVRRLKTGTPARLKRDTIDFSKFTEERGDAHFFPFSLRSGAKPVLPQVSCWLGRTVAQTHDIIRGHLHESPVYSGAIEGSGPRYCPSIEDKVTRFADRDSHQTFLEPEGLSTDWIYLQGISTSLPEAVQLEFLRTIPGLEKVDVYRFGYAVEYDFVEPTQLDYGLGSRGIAGLFSAGQVNGTSGYEEAAGQGVVAGVNAVAYSRGEEPLILKRNESYIGVMIDDLVSKGTSEPYRVFTSRAEYRMLLREDNVCERLGGVALKRGLLNREMFAQLESRRMKIERLRNELNSGSLRPNEETQNLLNRWGTSPLKKHTTLIEFVRRPEVSVLNLMDWGLIPRFEESIADSVEIETKYSGYLEREAEFARRMVELEEMRIPADIDFGSVRGLSSEERERLAAVRPQTVGQAARLSGVNPSAVQALVVRLISNGRR